jgi:hypothetical protein
MIFICVFYLYKTQLYVFIFFQIIYYHIVDVDINTANQIIKNIDRINRFQNHILLYFIIVILLLY